MKTPSDIVTFLKANVGLFAGFSDERLAGLVDGSRVASFEANEAIVHYGAQAAHLGIILSGAATGSVLGPGGTRQTVGRIEAGGTFGEMALMTGDAMLADIIAESRCEVLRIPVSLFQSVIVAEPGAVQYITRTIADRFKALIADPSAATAALAQSPDPYGLKLKGERPEKILVINCGSSSLKYSFYDTMDESRNARGLVERIGLAGTRHVYRGPKGEVKRELPQGGFAEAFKAMLGELTAKETGVSSGAGEVSVVAHRVVHGGERFTEATVISDEVLAHIEALNPLAPLHNPVNVAGIREMRRLFPAVPHVAVFDTAFHHTLPPYAFLYGLPYELYEQKGVRRYGFHGTSHAYVALRAAQFLKRRPNELQLVSCHLGNGSSLCAVDHGRSIDTSMGFTPAEGLIMGTRCGDVDAGVLAFLERSEGLTATQSEELLNKKSGLLGLSGVSSDMREVIAAADQGQHRSLIALKAYCYRVRKYIGSYVAAMGGLDAVIFTGGIGQGSAAVRALALQGLDCMGIKLDLQRNREARGFDAVCRISTDDSQVGVLVVPTDEERMMAREALRALSRSYIAGVLAAQKQQPFLVEVSAHHAHLTQEHVEKLYGAGHQLTRHTDLSQPGQFSCKEQVTLVGPKGRIERVRVLGPVRKATQVEIAMTEQFKLGVHPPVRESGDIAGTPGCTLAGPAGSVALERGVICALRHIHMTPADALRYGVRDKSFVRVRIAGDRELVFGDVLVRVDPNFSLAMHIDTDEGNAAGIETGAQGFIDGIQEENEGRASHDLF
ncbi:MAG TPA: acetate/propionate family kinase [Candidatus Margulisiibacteriota bacterium]|nr:acetate/propionate family kinase [Candidatus Margulisiibacteriota bacterium]